MLISCLSTWCCVDKWCHSCVKPGIAHLFYRNSWKPAGVAAAVVPPSVSLVLPLFSFCPNGAAYQIARFRALHTGSLSAKVLPVTFPSSQLLRCPRAPFSPPESASSFRLRVDNNHCHPSSPPPSFLVISSKIRVRVASTNRNPQPNHVISKIT